MKYDVGDSVMSYDYTNYGLRELRATVIAIEPDGSLEIETTGGTRYQVHPKQCRKLKLKRLRRLFLTVGEVENMYNRAVLPTPDAVRSTDIEFIEVKRGAK